MLLSFRFSMRRVGATTFATSLPVREFAAIPSWLSAVHNNSWWYRYWIRHCNLPKLCFLLVSKNRLCLVRSGELFRCVYPFPTLYIFEVCAWIGRAAYCSATWFRRWFFGVEVRQWICRNLSWNISYQWVYFCKINFYSADIQVCIRKLEWLFVKKPESKKGHRPEFRPMSIKFFYHLDNDVVARSDEFLPYFVDVFLVAGFEYDL